MTSEGEPATIYDIAPDGSVLKWWNTQVPPEIENLSGSLYANRETSGAITPGDYELLIQAFSGEGIARIQVVANGDQLVDEKTCVKTAEVSCKTVEDPWVTNTRDWPPGILQLEVIVTDSYGKTESARFWVNIPYTPPPDPEAPEPPRFEEILRFREQYGLDLDLKGNEIAIDERIFNLIGAWYNPQTAAGGVARATWERWGVPLRAVDAAEMEYRESYIAQDGPLIEQWGEEQAAGSYAGYYVAHSNGGAIRIAFTDHAKEKLSALLAEIQPVAADRFESVTASTGSSFASLRGVEEDVLNASLSISSLASSLRSVELRPEGNRVLVTSTNPSATSALLAEILGATAPVEVTESIGPYELDRLLAGENLRTHAKPSEKYELFSYCTAGPGAFEWITAKANGERLRAEFLLTAGHCFDVPGQPEKSIYPRGTDNFTPIGRRARNGLVGEQHYETDAQAVRLDGYHAPRYIYRPFRAPLSVGPPGSFNRGQVLCYSGVVSGVVRCGTAIGIRSIVIPEELSGRMWNIKLEMKPGAPLPSHGDSGAPVWEAGTRKIVGLVSGTEDGYGFVTPLLHPRGFPVEKVPGLLNAPGMGHLTLVSGP